MNEIVNKLSAEQKVVIQWSFKLPATKSIPDRIDFTQLLDRFNPGYPTPVTAIVMRLGQAYFEAGCPVLLCDYVACRDLWTEIQKQKRPGLGDYP